MRMFSRNLLLVSEHTWGRDMKRWKEVNGKWISCVEETYETTAFLQQRARGVYGVHERSWQEQRDYLVRALDAIQGTTFETDARAVVENCTLRAVDLNSFRALEAGSRLVLDNQLPDLQADGFHLNLYNNVWGTNFPMWYDEDALFRYRWCFDA